MTNLIAMHPGIIAFIIIAVVLLLIIIGHIRMIGQGTAIVVERLGKYNRTGEAGLKFLFPLLDKVRQRVSLKEQVADFRPSEVITKDNVKMLIDTIVFYQVTDPKLFTYGIDRPVMAIDNLTATTLRNIIGELDLDETLTSRDIINTKMRDLIDRATDPWGIKIHRVELRNILPPPTIQESMERQMRAERERREAILRAEGEKKSAILVAEGEKQSAILRAEAKKIALLTEAEGKALAIEKIVKAGPNAAYLSLEGFDALKSLAEGQATTIIVPSELQNVATMFTTMSEMLGTPGVGARKTAATTKAKTTKI